MFRLLIVLVLCCAALNGMAREGFVRTGDGNIYDGYLRFESNAVIVVNVEKGLRVEIALTNLLEVSFATPFVGALQRAREGVAQPSFEAWQHSDVGEVRLPGRTQIASGRFHLRGSGTNILGKGDAFHFAFQSAEGATELIARVTKVQGTHPWARAGLMMREGLFPGSRHVFLSTSAARGGVVQWRGSLGEETDVRLDKHIAVPCWLKLKRDGDIFTALSSQNGAQWRLVEKVEFRATRELYVGLAVVGVDERMLNHSIFEQVEQGIGLRNRWFVPQVELESGSLQKGYIAQIDDTAVHFDPVSGKMPVSRSRVANVRFQPVPDKLASHLSGQRSGVLLTTGEFMEGDCRGIEEGRMMFSSVPLGLKRLDCNGDVIALVLRKRVPPVTWAFELTTSEGSVWRATEVRLDSMGVHFREPSLGLRRIPAHEVLELRRRT